MRGASIAITILFILLLSAMPARAAEVESAFDTIVVADPSGRGIGFSGTIGGRSDDWRWLRARRGAVPEGAFVAGFEPGADHYVCRAPYKDGIHPGYLIVGERACAINHQGREIRAAAYDVLTGTAEDYTWVEAAGGAVPEGALVGGQMPGQPFYVCRAVIEEEFDYPGKLTQRGCEVARDGVEHTVGTYEVLVKR
jgi:hypothetical protein